MYYVKQSYLSWRYLLMQTSRQKKYYRRDRAYIPNSWGGICSNQCTHLKRARYLVCTCT